MEIIDIIALKEIKGIGDKSLKNLVESGYKIESMPNLDTTYLRKLIPASNQKFAIAEIKNNLDEYKERAFKNIQNYKELDITVISYWDKYYPPSLKLIKNPPSLLYAKGKLELLMNWNNAAISGTRNSTAKGDRIAMKTAEYFAGNGYTIISGLSEGIDTAGHNGAIDAKGKTIAVLVDVNNVVPGKNKGLANEILKNDGLLLSENPPDIFIANNLYISRDRILNGISLGIFIIEIDEADGILHTALYALRQNKLIYCPDHNEAKYKSDCPQISGIKKLLTENKAKKYTSHDYKSIIDELQRKKIELSSK